MKHKRVIKTTRQVVNEILVNSNAVRPYVKDSHYRRGVTILSMLSMVLKLFDKD